LETSDLSLVFLRGELRVRDSSVHSDGAGSHQLREHELCENESCVIPAGAEFELTATPELEMLAVSLPAE